jgi:NAD(P)-dependent dehydrogenase (short-subunit alcohol dehydrogenase family)
VSVDIDLEGWVCLIVGGAGAGIGSATSLMAAAAGAQVGVITHNPDHGAAVADEIENLGGYCCAVTADVTSEAEFVGATDQIEKSLGTIRHVVNVVGGRTEYQRPSEYDMDFFDNEMNFNLGYVIVSYREVARRLQAAGLGGSMVNISSGASRGAPLLSAYSAAKAGVEAFSRSVALAWGGVGIRVNVVSVGSVRTPRTGNQERPAATATVPLRRRGDPKDVAAMTVFLLSDPAGYTTGQTLHVDGGLHLGQTGGEELSGFVGDDNPRRSRYMERES